MGTRCSNTWAFGGILQWNHTSYGTVSGHSRSQWPSGVVVTSPNIWQSDWPQSVPARRVWDLSISHSCFSISKTRTVNMAGAQPGQLPPFPSSSVLNCLSSNIQDCGFSFFPPLSYYSVTHKQKSLETYRQKGASLYLGVGMSDWYVWTVRPWVHEFHQRWILATQKDDCDEKKVLQRRRGLDMCGAGKQRC